MVQVAEKKKLRVKKLKKEKPAYLIKKGHNLRRHMTDKNQCHFYYEDGTRCGSFSKRGSQYCRHHKSKDTHKRMIDFDLLEAINKVSLKKNEKLFSLKEYPQLVEIYRDRHPDKTIMKAAQCGVTEWAILFAKFFLVKHRGTTVIYTLPSRSLASSISKQRIDSLISENPKTFLNVNRKGHVQVKYDSIFEKQIKNGFLFLQGTWKESQTISTPGDVLIHDEIDFCKGNILKKFRSRIGNSDYKFVFKFSTPTYPEYGIHKEFLATDQHHWWYRCEHCGHIFKLCCSWPDILHFEDETDRPYFGCIKCHKEIARKEGWWKAENPSSSRRGYHITKLASPRVAAADMVEAKSEYKTEKDFWNFELGLPYAGQEDTITLADMEGCEDGRYHLLVRAKLTCAGVDQGGREIYVVVIQPGRERDRLIYVDHITGLNCWEELAVIMTQLGVVRCVVDALPDTFKAGEFQRAFKRKVYLAYYQEKAKEGIHWQPSKGIVTLNRNTTLDMSMDKIRNQRLIMPISDKLITFKKHMTSFVRTKEVDEEIGEIRYVYKKVRKDHFGHAYNYANVAAFKMEFSSFKVHSTTGSQQAARNVAQGNYGDEVVNHLAGLLLDKLITIESIMLYRVSKLNGKFVSEMDSLDSRLKEIFGSLELKYSVADLLASIQNLEIVKDRIEIIKQQRIKKAVEGES